MTLRQNWYDHKFARIARRLRNYPRGRSSSAGKWDVLADLASGTSSNLFLGVYGDVAIMDLLGKFGILNALASRGIDHPVLELDLSNPYRHILRLYQQAAGPDALVAEFVFRYADFSGIRTSPGADGYPCLHLEWLLLQNPTRNFDADHSALPDQNHPALQMGGMTLSLLARMSRYLGVDGIFTVPANMHSALFFARSYLATTHQVQLNLAALARAVRKLGRLEVAWAERWGDLLHSQTGENYRWEPATMVSPNTVALKSALKKAASPAVDDAPEERDFLIRPGLRFKRLPDGRVERDYSSGRP